MEYWAEGSIEPLIAGRKKCVMVDPAPSRQPGFLEVSWTTAVVLLE